MSKVMRSLRPVCWPAQASPSAPAADPESAERIGCSEARLADVTPPLDFMMKIGACIPAERTSASIPSR